MAVAATMQLLLECMINLKILIGGEGEKVFSFHWWAGGSTEVYILSLTIALHLTLFKDGQQKINK